MHGPVRTIARLKVRILLNGFANPLLRRKSIFAVAATLVAGGVGGFVVIRHAGADPAAGAPSLVTSFTLMFAAWLFAPLGPGGLDDTIDPGRLALLPLTDRERRWGVLSASMIGLLPLTSLLVLGAVVIAHAGGAATPFVVAAVVMHLALCIMASRAVGALLTRAGQSRRGRDLALAAASLAAVGLWGATQSLVFVSAQTYAQVLRVLELLPTGICARAIVASRTGHFGEASLRIAIAGVFLGGLSAVWSWAFDGCALPGTAVRPPARRRDVRIRGFTGRASAAPIAQWRVLVGREFRYLRRSPQRRASLIISVVLAGPFLLIQFFSHATRTEGVYLAPMALVFAFGSVSNLLGLDAPSLWLEVTSGVSLRTIIMSRSIAAAPLVLLPVLTAATAIAAVVGFTSHYLTVVVLTFAGAGVPLGVGSVASVFVPLPQPDVDDPFSNRRTATGEGCLVGFVAALSMAATGALFMPLIVARAGLGRMPAGPIVLSVLTAVYSWAVWFACASAAGNRADRRSAELLSTLTSRNLAA